MNRIALFFLDIYQFDTMSRSGYKMPNAILFTRIKVRIIRTGNVTSRRRNFMLAATLFTVVFVIVQRETAVARAFVRADHIVAFVLATAVINRAFVHICA